MLPREASMAKLKVTETARRVALDGMQMMGGYGYATEYDMEGHVRRTLVATVYGGTNVRFRLLGGTFRIKVIGRGVNLSVVGTGKVTLNGDDTAADDGTFSFNGDPYQPVLAGASIFALNVSTP